jgi:hypothetical protein
MQLSMTDVRTLYCQGVESFQETWALQTIRL